MSKLNEYERPLGFWVRGHCGVLSEKEECPHSQPLFGYCESCQRFDSDFGEDRDSLGPPSGVKVFIPVYFITYKILVRE